MQFVSPWCPRDRVQLELRIRDRAFHPIHLPPSVHAFASPRPLNPAATEFVPKTNKPKPTHNPLGGKLALVATGFFERAYGLNGQKRVDHVELKAEMMSLTGCSERAVQAVLYGSSYNNLLEGLRAQIPGYTVQKDMQQDFTLLPFYSFDGNLHSRPSVPEVHANVIPMNTNLVPSANLIPMTTVSHMPLAPMHTTNEKHKYSTVALCALAAILPFTLFC